MEAVTRNRAIAASELGLAPEQLVTCHQVHGTKIVTAERPWRRENNPHADGTVTNVPGIALGVLALVVAFGSIKGAVSGALIGAIMARDAEDRPGCSAAPLNLSIQPGAPMISGHP